MKTTAALRAKAAQLLAADTATLAQAANANVIALVMAPFTPGESISIGDLTLATFDGNTPIAVGLTTQPTALDPNTNDMIIDMIPPVTGFRWQTSGVTNLPQTIYGYALLDHTLATIFATDLLPSPVTLTAIDQRVDVGAPNIRQLANSMV
jgi:hypothetical protein